MSLWWWFFIAVGTFLAVYAAFVLILLLVGRRTDARAWATATRGLLVARIVNRRDLQRAVATLPRID